MILPPISCPCLMYNPIRNAPSRPATPSKTPVWLWPAISSNAIVLNENYSMVFSYILHHVMVLLKAASAAAGRRRFHSVYPSETTIYFSAFPKDNITRINHSFIVIWIAMPRSPPHTASQRSATAMGITSYSTWKLPVVQMRIVIVKSISFAIHLCYEAGKTAAARSRPPGWGGQFLVVCCTSTICS